MALSTREDKVVHALLWLTARNRSTGLPETIGLWTGDDTQVINIDGSNRTYYGPAILNIPAIDGGVGLDVRQVRIPLPHLVPEVITALRTYDPKLAPVEIHFAEFSTDTRAFLGAERVFKGWVNESPIGTAADGGEGSGELILVSASRSLTKTLPVYRSHADQQNRSAGDEFREYASTTGLKEVWWGEGKVIPAPRAAARPSGSTSISNEIAGKDQYGNLVYKGR